MVTIIDNRILSIIVTTDDIDKGENMFVQKREKGVVNKNWLLLDSQSTVDQIANPAMLKNIRKAASTVTVHCNAGSTSTNLEGDLGSVTVKHNPHSIANMVSLHETKQRHRVTYDSWDQAGCSKFILMADLWSSNQAAVDYTTMLYQTLAAMWS